MPQIVYSIINNSTNTTATINYMTIDTDLSKIEHKLDLTGWLPPFNAYTSGAEFGGGTTLRSKNKSYVDDVSPVNKIIQRYTSTNYIQVNNTTGIGAGWTVEGNILDPGSPSPSVVGFSATNWIVLSGTWDNTPVPGDVLTISPPETLLIVNNVTDLEPGWIASGGGGAYNGQTIVSISGTNTLIMSGPPVSNPSGSITFTSNGDTMLEIAPLSSATFKMDYNRVTSILATYESLVKIYGVQGSSFIKNVDNFALISAAPVTDPISPFYDPGAGGNSSGGPGPCSDTSPTSSTSCPSGPSCFTANTLITLSNGKFKPISEIEIGDLVLDALTGQANKVIGLKKIVVPAGTYLFSPDSQSPFMTEEHPFYNEAGELCAVSALAEMAAPWLGPIKVVDIQNKIKLDYPTQVYNLILETGNSHYANNIPVNNIIGHGNTYVLLYKGFIDEATYLNNTRNLDKALQTRESLLFYYRVFHLLASYVLYHDNWLSKLIGRFGAYQLSNRDKTKKYWDAVSRSALGKLIKKVV